MLLSTFRFEPFSLLVCVGVAVVVVVFWCHALILLNPGFFISHLLCFLVHSLKCCWFYYDCCCCCFRLFVCLQLLLFIAIVVDVVVVSAVDLIVKQFKPPNKRSDADKRSS